MLKRERERVCGCSATINKTNVPTRTAFAIYEYVYIYIYKKCLAFRRAFDVPSLILAEISQRFFGFGFENFFSLVKR